MAIVYNNEQIKEIIPHRYPFLLVDVITEVGENEEGQFYIVGKKNVTANEPHFVGHFPQYQVMPGVLIVEALAQVGCVGMLAQEEHRGKLGMFTSIDKVKIRQQVVPGDTLELRVDMIAQKKMGERVFGTGKAVAKVDGKVALQGEIGFVITPQE
ncbi:3-hydroxyacyl-ACP dehydratase FabZ [Culicoidibacter larvae]|uniref:3-hydroxyacyl-[acyl-carrier-protein] dehydratase n=1 Tax=Culicoidibacter larvae TaxID=2579976 RepID=A0A5R8QGD5_9FIRM|nr:3-hydroxyacyl-ACP dehydratase FabZ [Culicoidibacter larvae]TLG77058.1 beta-hydroxyacyl-ACP dehydratase [Culicoidibacter larvae]